MPLSYQLITFQGSRHALFCFNRKGKQGGYAEFDNFTVVEPDADRSGNIPYGKTFRIVNLATGHPAIALKHGLLHDTDAKDNSKLTRFRLIDKGQGQVVLQCEDGRYVFCSGFGMAGDVRLTTDESKAEVFMWQAEPRVHAHVHAHPPLSRQESYHGQSLLLGLYRCRPCPS